MSRNSRGRISYLPLDQDDALAEETDYDIYDAMTSHASTSSQPGASVTSSDCPDVTFVNMDERSRDKTEKFLYDPDRYLRSIENEDTMKCVASSAIFLVICAALLIIMFWYNPQM